MSDKGYFMIDRGLLEHFIWTEDKPFSRGQAWVDLIGRANWKATERWSGAELVKVKRGQLLTSEGALAERWGWSRGKVRRYLDALEKAEMIVKNSTAKGTAIFLENYAKYQSPRPTDGTANEQQTDRKRTANGTLKNKDNKDNKGEEYARTRATPDDDWVIVYDPEEDER